LINDGTSNAGSDTNSGPNTDSESVASSGTATPLPGSVEAARATVCPLQVRRGLGANTLRLKQGRRTKQRCENEKMLLSMYGIDEDDVWGSNIPSQTRSYFLDLMNEDNEELLEQFINNEEPQYFNSERITRKSRGGFTAETFQPEEAFIKIGFNLRQALKKHPPMGMLEGLESKLNETFTKNPHTEYVMEDLSSFERLLLHALCSYNSLNSNSFDFAGKRLVRVENPYQTFFRKQPGLCEYLLQRINKNSSH